MRTTFNIEDGLLEEAKTLARKRKTTLGSVVNDALRLGLLRSGESNSNVANDPLKTFCGDGLQSGVDLRNSAELLDQMERA